eukprot:1203052-Amphidinium_carterae.1
MSQIESAARRREMLPRRSCAYNRDFMTVTRDYFASELNLTTLPAQLFACFWDCTTLGLPAKMVGHDVPTWYHTLSTNVNLNCCTRGLTWYTLPTSAKTNKFRMINK